MGEHEGSHAFPWWLCIITLIICFVLYFSNWDHFLFHGEDIRNLTLLKAQAIDLNGKRYDEIELRKLVNQLSIADFRHNRYCVQLYYTSPECWTVRLIPEKKRVHKLGLSLDYPEIVIGCPKVEEIFRYDTQEHP